jgi:glutaredoxin-related protein
MDVDGQVVGGVEMFRDLTQVVELRKKLEGSTHLKTS